MRAWNGLTAGLAALWAATALHAEPSPAPPWLSQTRVEDGSALSFSPQYPLWSDGADKQRWLQLPPGTAIDARDPDAWVFPVGTRLWKQFSHGGRPIETRLIERRADGWHYATYVWRADGSDADLAPPRGIGALPVPAAPGGRYAVPGHDDCVACHGGATVPVLGLSALQLSPAQLRELVERGLVRGLPRRLLDEPPRIAARSDLERAALGYLHGNCAHCHHPNPGRVPVGLTLLQRAADPERSAADALRSMLDAPSRYQPRDDPSARAVAPGDARSSLLLQRMRARDGRAQMPPLGTDRPDAAALELLTRWIDLDLPRHKEP
jgi:hypothetical protein